MEEFAGQNILKGDHIKNKGLDRHPAPFLNPISYEKPIMRPVLCNKRCTIH